MSQRQMPKDHPKNVHIQLIKYKILATTVFYLSFKIKLYNYNNGNEHINLKFLNL